MRSGAKSKSYVSEKQTMFCFWFVMTLVVFKAEVFFSFWFVVLSTQYCCGLYDVMVTRPNCDENTALCALHLLCHHASYLQEVRHFSL